MFARHAAPTSLRTRVVLALVVVLVVTAAVLADRTPSATASSTTDGQGYWLVGSDGGISSSGNARFHGSTGALTLNGPIVGMAATADGQG